MRVTFGIIALVAVLATACLVNCHWPTADHTEARARKPVPPAESVERLVTLSAGDIGDVQKQGIESAALPLPERRAERPARWGFVSQDMTVSEAFISQFALTPRQASELQALVDHTSERLWALSKQNATVTTDRAAVVVEIKPFFQGGDVCDEFLESAKKLLGDAYPRFTAEYGEFYTTAFRYFGAEQRRISFEKTETGEILYDTTVTTIIQGGPVLEGARDTVPDMAALRRRMGILIDLLPPIF